MFIIRKPWALATALFLIAGALFLSAGMAHADTGTDGPAGALLTGLTLIAAAPFIAFAAFVILCGLISARIAAGKGRNAEGFFALALILGPFAVMTALLVERTGPAKPVLDKGQLTTLGVIAGVVAIFIALNHHAYGLVLAVVIGGIVIAVVKYVLNATD